MIVAEIIGADRARRGIELRVALFRAVMHQALHVHGVGGLHRIHDHDSFDRGLVLNAAHFQQVFLGGDENHARPRIPQNVCRLFPGQRWCRQARPLRR